MLRTFPFVRLPKVRKPASAIAKHATKETNVLKCVTVENRSMVGVFKDPYIKRELWWQTNARLVRLVHAEGSFLTK